VGAGGTWLSWWAPRILHSDALLRACAVAKDIRGGGGWAVLIRVKRVYDPASSADGFRVLVDRLWPRGLSRGRASVHLWLREIAPSDALRRWFGHRPERWGEFKLRYFGELGEKIGLAESILEKEREHGVVTLLFSARDPEHNNAVALKEFLENLAGRRG